MLELSTLQDTAHRARIASRTLALSSSASKDAALLELSRRLTDEMGPVLAANRADVADAEDIGLESSLIDRLLLTPDRLSDVASDVRQIVSLPDPVNEEFDGRMLPNGLRIACRRVPLGVIGIIYESRPNVTIDVSALCLKSGNAVILRGGKESRRSSAALVELVQASLDSSGMPADAVQLIGDPDRELVGEMVRMRGKIDLIVPRGGAGLIQYIRDNAQVPVVAGGIGVCHTYVDESADLTMALEIVHNAKTRRPSVCNTLDTVLVHQSIAPVFLPALARNWATVPVEMRCEPRALSILEHSGVTGPYVPAGPHDFGTEFLALRAAVKVVDSLADALHHIEEYGSGHSEAIVTENYSAANEFLDRVDAAAVFVNASTSFNDGAQLGLGAELGISTQKFHARGPLGLRELTSYKWVVQGDGQVRS